MGLFDAIAIHFPPEWGLMLSFRVKVIENGKRRLVSPFSLDAGHIDLV